MHHKAKLCLAALVSATAMFATNAHAVNIKWIPPTTVKTVYPHLTGVSFYMDGPVISSSSSCASQNRFNLLNTHANFYAVYSLLLTALTEQKGVWFSYDDDDTTCAVPVTYILINK